MRHTSVYVCIFVQFDFQPIQNLRLGLHDTWQNSTKSTRLMCPPPPWVRRHIPQCVIVTTITADVCKHSSDRIVEVKGHTQCRRVQRWNYRVDEQDSDIQTDIERGIETRTYRETCFCIQGLDRFIKFFYVRVVMGRLLENLFDVETINCSVIYTCTFSVKYKS